MKIVGAFLACGLLAAVIGAQEAAQEESELDRLMRAATQGRAVVRPQAARRLVRLWTGGDEQERAAIVERLVREAGSTPAELAALGSGLVEVLGEFGDERLRDALWEALDDRDFPWRPYSARALGTTARADEEQRYAHLLDDPIAPVRAAALTGLDTLAARTRAALVRARLEDQDDRVRRAAADLLVDWGQPDALWWLLEELAREDSFFGRPTGEQARYQAAQLLTEHLGELGDLDPSQGPAANRAALAALGRRIEERAGPRPELPPVARAGERPPPEVIGLELRSCRRGEYFLRWTRDDRLLVGMGRPAVVPLPAGTVAALVEDGTEDIADLKRRFFGSPGCDVEQFHWQPGEDPMVWLVSKGPEAVEDLRPAELGELYARLVATLPDDPADDPRLDRLRSRTLAALEAIGGPL